MKKSLLCLLLWSRRLNTKLLWQRKLNSQLVSNKLFFSLCKYANSSCKIKQAPNLGPSLANRKNLNACKRLISVNLNHLSQHHNPNKNSSFTTSKTSSVMTQKVTRWQLSCMKDPTSSTVLSSKRNSTFSASKSQVNNLSLH
jgi:hypothetical protein